MRDGLAKLDQSCPELLADRDQPARFSFARCVLEADYSADVPLGVVSHPPGEPGDLLGSQACLARQEEDQAFLSGRRVLAK
jgi:hypothetical protein